MSTYLDYSRIVRSTVSITLVTEINNREPSSARCLYWSWISYLVLFGIFFYIKNESDLAFHIRYQYSHLAVKAPHFVTTSIADILIPNRL